MNKNKSEYKNTRTDSLLPTSFGFQVFKTYLNLPTWKEKFGFQANAQRRYDSASKGKSLGLATFADEWSLIGFFKTKETSRLDLSFNYRTCISPIPLFLSFKLPKPMWGGANITCKCSKDS